MWVFLCTSVYCSHYVLIKIFILQDILWTQGKRECIHYLGDRVQCSIGMKTVGVRSFQCSVERNCGPTSEPRDHLSECFLGMQSGNDSTKKDLKQCLDIESWEKICQIYMQLRMAGDFPCFKKVKRQRRQLE